MANSEDPDEMPHVAAFQQGLHCLLINLHRKEFIIFINYNRYPLNIIITLDHHGLTVLLFMENSIGLKGVNNHTSPFEQSQINSVSQDFGLSQNPSIVA